MTILLFQESDIACFAAKERHAARLRAAFPTAQVKFVPDEATFLAELPQAEVALTWYWRQAWFAQAPKLRFIATPAAGHDFFQVTPPETVEIHHGAYHGEFMAESLLGMMLAFERGILESQRRQMRGELWPRTEIALPRSIRGTHAVFIGIGNVAQWCVAALKPFGVRITGVCRHPEAARLPSVCTAEDRVVGMDELEAVLPTADHVILVLPNDTGTDRLLDARRFALLPRHAVVYNIGRGNAIDEGALAAALRARALRGACLDVFAEEPLTAASPLAENLPGLLRLAHITAFDEQYIDRATDEAIAWLKRRGCNG